METIKKGLPSFFTSLGLISGCISIVFAVSSNGYLTLAGYFILIAAFFDFLDGLVARWVHHVSEFGKQLDSLADVVSFGVAPAMILFRMILLSYVKSSPGADFDVVNPAPWESVIMFSTFLVAVFSALRLAKFNLDESQIKNFRGLPTPANALFIAALGFSVENGKSILASDIILSRGFLFTVVVLSCYLLVSNISMFSLKFSSYKIKPNLLRYLFLLLSVILLAIFQLPGLAPVIVLYILLSLLNNRFVKME